MRGFFPFDFAQGQNDKRRATTEILSLRLRMTGAEGRRARRLRGGDYEGLRVGEREGCRVGEREGCRVGGYFFACLPSAIL